MKPIESTILVSRSVEDVFNFLSIAENHAKFIPNMIEFNEVSPGQFGPVGSAAQGVLRFWGQKMKVPYEIIESEANQKLAMKGVLGPVSFKDGYVLSRGENGTLIKFWLVLMLSGFGRLMSPFAGLVGQVHARETLTNLKNALERGNK
jgi:hypothetical protein